MGAWAPQHPFAERDFQMPNCLLVIKCSVEVGCGVWQGKVSDKRWYPCSSAGSSFGEISVDFGVYSVALRALSSLGRREAETGAGG